MRQVPRHTKLVAALKLSIDHFSAMLEDLALSLEGSSGEGFVEDPQSQPRPSTGSAVLAWLLRIVKSLVLGVTKQLAAVIDPILSAIPFYPVNLLLGLVVGAMSYEIASSRTLHYVIGALLGFTVALIWVAIVLYRYVRCLLDYCFRLIVHDSIPSWPT